MTDYPSGQENPFFAAATAAQEETKERIQRINISSYRGNDDEPWRNVRVHRVATRLAAYPRIARHIHRLHDHKGTLFYSLSGAHIPGHEIGMIYPLIEAAWAEENECVVEPWSELAYSPHPQDFFTFVVEH